MRIQIKQAACNQYKLCDFEHFCLKPHCGVECVHVCMCAYAYIPLYKYNIMYDLFVCVLLQVVYAPVLMSITYDT